MDTIELVAQPRERNRKNAKHLRGQGLIPAVLYGRGVETQLLQIEERPLEKVLAVAGSYQLITLKIEGEQPIMSLAREIQRDVIKRNCMHVDFFRVRMDEKVTAQVPLIIKGESPAVRDEGGILTQGLDEIEIECLPSHLIASLTINIDSLAEINDTLFVTDLEVPDNITILSDPDSMIVKIEAPRKEEELEALEEETVLTSAEPEVITESREDDEDGFSDET